MADEQVVKQLVERLSSEDAAVQESTAEQIKYAMLYLRAALSGIRSKANLTALQGPSTKQCRVLHCFWATRGN